MRIWKRCFRSESTSRVFRPHYAGEIWTRNNHRPFFQFGFEEISAGKSPTLFLGSRTWERGWKITWLSLRHRFWKAPFTNYFSSTLKRKTGVFKFLRLKSVFKKLLFRKKISVDGRPNRRNEAAFSNFSGEVWTLPWLYFFCFLLAVTFLFLKLLRFFRQNQLLVTWK